MSCCDRPSTELPLGDGLSTSEKDVTCDGTFTPAVWAHEVYPHRDDEWEAPPLDYAVKYHLARAIAFCPPIDTINEPGWAQAIVSFIREAHIAALVVALAKNLTGQQAYDFAQAATGDGADVLWDYARKFGVDLDRIKPYDVTERKPAPVVPAEEEPEGTR